MVHYKRLAERGVYDCGVPRGVVGACAAVAGEKMLWEHDGAQQNEKRGVQLDEKKQRDH